MIKVIYGSKGSGKTKMLIDAANAAVATAKGHLIFITDTKRYMYDLERDVRFIDVSDYDIAGETVYFEIFPHYFTAYDVPALDETFILETLELTEEALSSYEGETVVDESGLTDLGNGKVTLQSGYLNIRAEASTLGAKLGTIPNGAVVALNDIKANLDLALKIK